MSKELNQIASLETLVTKVALPEDQNHALRAFAADAYLAGIRFFYDTTSIKITDMKPIFFGFLGFVQHNQLTTYDSEQLTAELQEYGAGKEGFYNQTTRRLNNALSQSNLSSEAQEVVRPFAPQFFYLAYLFAGNNYKIRREGQTTRIEYSIQKTFDEIYLRALLSFYFKEGKPVPKELDVYHHVKKAFRSNPYYWLKISETTDNILIEYCAQAQIFAHLDGTFLSSLGWWERKKFERRLDKSLERSVLLVTPITDTFKQINSARRAKGEELSQEENEWADDQVKLLRFLAEDLRSRAETIENASLTGSTSTMTEGL